MGKKFICIFFLTILLGLFLNAGFVVAVTTPGNTQADPGSQGCSRPVGGVVYPCDPLNWNLGQGEGTKEGISKVVKNIINSLLALLGAGAFVMFFYGGTQILFAAGDANRLKKGRNAVLYAVIGLAAIFLSYAVLNFVLSIFSSAQTLNTP